MNTAYGLGEHTASEQEETVDFFAPSAMHGYFPSIKYTDVFLMFT